MRIDYDKPLLCPTCGSRMEVRISCWVTPGADFELSDVDYETATNDSDQFWCAQCRSHHFPAEQEAEAHGATCLCPLCRTERAAVEAVKGGPT